MKRVMIPAVLGAIFLLVTVLAAPLVFVVADGGDEREGEAELEDPGNYAFGPSGVTAEIEFVDDGTTLTITGEAEGLTPGVPYVSLIYDIFSSAEGDFACEPGLADDDPSPFNIFATMFVGEWVVDEDGDGTLSAINIGPTFAPGPPVYVSLSKIGTISIRDGNVEGPFGLGTGPAAVVACGVVEAEDLEEEEDEEAEELFESEGMRGLTTPFTNPMGAPGPTKNIRGVPGAGLPWVIDEGEVRIDADGRLRVEVEGLVIDPAVGGALGGTNPAPSFRVIVSCITGVDGSGNPTFTNIESDVDGTTLSFPTAAEGDGELDATITLPDTCFGIIVFVTAPNGSWFAATGF